MHQLLEEANGIVVSVGEEVVKLLRLCELLKMV